MKLEPVRMINLPIVKRLRRKDILSRDNIENYVPYPDENGIDDGKIFGYDIKNKQVTDLINIAYDSILVIDRSELFRNGDKVIVTTTAGGIILGRSQLMSGQEIMLKNKTGKEHSILLFSDIIFIGRIISGITIF